MIRSLENQKPQENLQMEKVERNVICRSCDYSFTLSVRRNCWYSCPKCGHEDFLFLEATNVGKVSQEDPASKVSDDVVTLHLDVKVTIQRNGESVAQLKERLEAIVNHAHDEGLFTGEGGAEIVSLSYNVSEVKS